MTATKYYYEIEEQRYLTYDLNTYTSYAIVCIFLKDGYPQKKIINDVTPNKSFALEIAQRLTDLNTPAENMLSVVQSLIDRPPIIK